MAYRIEHPGDLCTRCRERADHQCLRCAQPFCAEHVPAVDRRCDVCESDHLSKETRTVRTLVVSVTVAAGITGFVGVLATHAARNGHIAGPNAHMVPLILYASLAAFAGSFAAVPLLRRYLRNRFLRERRR